MHGLEQARCGRAGSHVRARRRPHAALEGRGEVGEDVCEQVRRDDDVETARVAHHAGGERVDEDPLVAHRRKRGRDLLCHIVPEDVAEAGSVRLRRARDDATAALGELEGVPHDALDAGTREDARLDPDLGGEALVRPPTHSRVLTLGVLAHEEHVDVCRAPARERAGDPFQQSRRPQVGPEIELLADRQDDAPQRDVIGTDGSPTAPIRQASCARRTSRASSGIMRPCSCQ